MILLEKISSTTLKNVLRWEKQHINFISKKLQKMAVDEPRKFPNDDREAFYTDLSLLLNSSQNFKKYQMLISTLTSKKNAHRRKAFGQTYYLDGRWFNQVISFLTMNGDVEKFKAFEGWKSQTEPTEILDCLSEHKEEEAIYFKVFFAWWKAQDGIARMTNETVDGSDDTEDLETQWNSHIQECLEALKSDQHSVIDPVFVKKLRDITSNLDAIVQKNEEKRSIDVVLFYEQLQNQLDKFEVVLDKSDEQIVLKLQALKDAIANKICSTSALAFEAVSALSVNLENLKKLSLDMIKLKSSGLEAFKNDDDELSEEILINKKLLKKDILELRNKCIGQFQGLTQPDERTTVKHNAKPEIEPEIETAPEVNTTREVKTVPEVKVVPEVNPVPEVRAAPEVIDSKSDAEANIVDTPTVRASSMLTKQELSDCERVMASSLEKGEWGSLYWISWGMTELQSNKLDHNLLASFILSSQIRTEGILSDTFREQLREINSKEIKDKSNKLLLSGALMVPMLFSHGKPNSFYSLASSFGETGLPDLDVIFNAIKDFGLIKQLVIDKSDLNSNIDKQSKESELRDLVLLSLEELERVKHNNINYKFADKLLNSYYRQGEKLYKIHHIVENNLVKNLSILERLVQTIDPEYLIDNPVYIPGFSTKVLKSIRITGLSRRRVISHMNNTIDIGRRWMEIHSSKIPTEGSEDFKKGELEKLHRIVSSNYESACDGLNDLTNSSEQPFLFEIAHALKISLDGLRSMLIGKDISVADSFSKYLIPYYSIVLDDEFMPDSKDAADVLRDIKNGNISSDFKHNIGIFLSRKEFVRAYEIVKNAEGDALIEEQYLKCQEESVALLQSKIVNLEHEIEDAHLLGELSSIETSDSEHQQIVSSRVEMVAKISHISDVLSRTNKANPLRYAEIIEPITNIEKDFTNLKDARIERISQRKSSLIEKLSQYPDSKNDCVYFEKTLKKYTRDGDVVAASELLVQVEDAIGKNKPLVNLSVPRGGAIYDFSESEKIITDEFHRNKRFIIGMIKDIKNRVNTLGFPFNSLNRRDKERTTDALQAINDFRRERADTPSFANSVVDKLSIILDAIGFEVQKNVKHTMLGTSVGEYYFAAVGLELSPDSPIPSFGSELGIRIPVLLLRKNFSPNDLIRLLKKLGYEESQILVVQSAPVTKPFRNELQKVCVSSRRKSQMMFVDFSMLVFILSRKDRLNLLFDLTLPFTWSQPYMMKGENVPREMFVGRDEEVNQLLDRDGPCIVYGGRQLGKSALLKHVVNEYHKPDDGLFVCYLDIDDIGSGIDSGTISYEDMVFTFWSRVHKGLVNSCFCEDEIGQVSNRQHKKMETLVSDILIQNLNGNNRRVLLLLDETDDLISADFGKDFHLLRRLRGLMAETNRAFKVVFAGLHSVQRYKKLSNHPFAQLGEEIVIRPLSTAAAKELVTKPLKVLGFEFEKSNLIMGIFAPVNYHPGLIQIFCFRLLENLYDRIKRGMKQNYTFMISRDDIVAIERNREFRSEIRDRFDWTLDLDDRYKLLIYALVLSERPTEALTINEFQQLGSQWWPQEFSKLDQLSSRALLDEMEGLGVLASVEVNSSVKYQLRSPNLLRLLGNKDEIERELTRIISQPSRKVSNANNYHNVIDNKPFRFGCFAMDQCGNLFSERELFSVKLIFGSHCLGARYIEKELLDISSNIKDKSKWIHREIRPQFLTSQKRIMSYLSKELKPTDRKNIYYIIDASLLPEDMFLPDVICEIDTVFSKCCRKGSKARLFFNMNPEETLKWILNNSAQELEGHKRISEVKLRPWSDGAIWKGLEKAKILAGAKTESEAIFNFTAGMHLFVDEILSYAEKDKKIVNGVDVTKYTKNFFDDEANTSNINHDIGINVLPPEIISSISEVLEMLEKDEETKGYIFDDDSFELISENIFELNPTLFRDKESMFGDVAHAELVLTQYFLDMGLILPRSQNESNGKYLMLPLVRDCFAVEE